MKEGPRKDPRSSTTPRDRSEWIAIPCPAIVRPELFDAAHQRLQVNKERALRNCKTFYLLRRLVRCEICGYGLYTQAATHGRVYICGGKAKHLTRSVMKRCTNRTYYTSALENLVWEAIVKELSDPDRLRATLDALTREMDNGRSGEENELAVSIKLEREVKTERERLINLYTNALIELPELHERLAANDKRKAELDAERAQIMARVEQRQAAKASLEAIAMHARPDRLPSHVARGAPEAA